jgi:drug/metabolite transporter (DMT)-like permease
MAVLLAYILLCLIWGSSWLAIRIGLADMPPFWSLAIRLVLALGFLLAVARMRRTPFSSLLRHPGTVLLVSALTYPVAYGLVYWSEQYVTSGLAAVMFSAMPFFVALLSWWLLPAERISARTAVGLVLGTSGLVVIYWDQVQLGDIHRVLGMLGITGSALVAAFTSVMIKRQLKDVPAVALATSTTAFGALLVPIAALGFERVHEVHFSISAVGAILYLAVFASAVTFMLYYHLLRRISALTMSLIAFITPLVALYLGTLFDYESFSLRAWIGTALVLAGVLLAALKSVPRSHIAPEPLADERR